MRIRFVSAPIVLAIAVGICFAGGSDEGEIALDFIPTPIGSDFVSHRTEVADGEVSYSVLAEYNRHDDGGQSFCGIQFIAQESDGTQVEPQFYGACRFDYYASIKGLPDIACREPSAIFYHPRYGLRIVSVTQIFSELGTPPDGELDAYLGRVAETYGFARSWFPPGGVIRSTEEEGKPAEPEAGGNDG